MELLNNIWMAINTPNPVILNACLILLNVFLEIPLTFQLIVKVFNFEYTIKKELIFILVSSLASLLSMFIIPWPFNIVLNYLSIFLVLFITLKPNIFKAIIATVLPSIIFNLIGNLLFNPYLTILNITYEQATSIPIYRVPFALVMYLIVFVGILIIRYKNITYKTLDNIDKKNKSIITINFVFGFFNIIMQCILTINYIDYLPITFTFFNVICLTTYFGLSFYSLAKIITLVDTTQKLESAEAYNKTLHILHDSVRGFKHDFDNIVATIGGYVNTNDMNGLKNYYSQLVEDCSRVNNLYTLNPEIINNPGIYNLLATKYSKATEQNIKINLTFLLDLNELHMKIYDFARILGILLDNSIEATSECEDKTINIVFRNEAKNNRNIIQIENTYKNKDVDLDEIFNKGVSGKENHTGLGLWEIRQILKKNNHINLHTSKNDTYFTQQLEIYY